MEIIVIAAVSDNNVIGQNGKIPWRLPVDMARFKALTMGNVLIMGRKTWDSLPARELEGRFIVVVSSSPLKEKPSTVFHAPDPETAVTFAALLMDSDYDVYICGGASVYKALMPCATRIELTRVHEYIPGRDADKTFFPMEEFSKWIEDGYDRMVDRHLGYDFETYYRKKEKA